MCSVKHVLESLVMDDNDTCCVFIDLTLKCDLIQADLLRWTIDETPLTDHFVDDRKNFNKTKTINGTTFTSQLLNTSQSSNLSSELYVEDYKYNLSVIQNGSIMVPVITCGQTGTAIPCYSTEELHSIISGMYR